MRLRNTLLLASVFGLLAAYVYFFELGKGIQGKTVKLLDFKEAEAQSLVLSYPDREIRLQRDPQGRWQIVQPLVAAADESTVGAILSALSAGEVKRTVQEKPGAAELRNYGLDRPEVKVSISLRDGTVLPPISVGGAAPLGNSAYVRRGADAGVLLTDASLRANLARTLNDLRSKRILEVGPETIQEIALSGAQGDFVLAKKGGLWFIERPRYYRADQQEVQGMLSTIHTLSTQDFIEEAPLELKKFGFNKPRLRISLAAGEEGQAHEILFGDKRQGSDDVYALVDAKGTVYAVDDGVVKQLEKGLPALRDKEILSARPDQIARLEIRTPKDSVVLVKGENEEWRVEAPKKGKTKPGVVADYLSLLGRVRAKGFAEDEAKDLKKYGLDSPALQIAVADRKGKNLGTLLLGSQTGAEYYSALASSPAVYTIDESTYQQLNKQLADFIALPLHS